MNQNKLPPPMVVRGQASLVNYKTFIPIQFNQNQNHNRRQNLERNCNVLKRASNDDEGQGQGQGQRGQGQGQEVNHHGWSYNNSSMMSKILSDPSIGIKPLSPEKRRKKPRDCLFNNKLHSDDAKEFSNECDAVRVMGRNLGIYYPTVPNFPDSFHRFKRRTGEKNETFDGFSTLPDEMILPILKWLPKQSLGNLAQASKRFARLIEDESLWKKIDALGKVLEPGHLGVIISRKPVYLRLAKATIIDPSSYEELNPTELKYLDLSMSMISSPSLTSLLTCCPMLTKLSLEHLELPIPVLKSMRIFAQTIETLNLTMCYDLNAGILAEFFAQAKKLKMLNMSCVKVDWTETDLELVIKNLPATLEQLNLAGFRTVMKDRHTKQLTLKQKNLIDLDLSDCQELTGKTIQNISTSFPELQHLALSRCYSIEPTSYGMLANMKNLRYLELFSLFKEAGIKTLSCSLPDILINQFPFSAIARPTVGNKRSSIWLVRVRD